MAEPTQKPGRSKQDYGTPPTFLAAVAARFGFIDADLACTRDNAVAPLRLTEDIDSLKQDWRTLAARVAFLNPPFGDIRPWAAKLDAECRELPRWTLMLVPASMGSKWWADHVLGKCMAFGIPRMQFVGADALYPKDLALLAYGFGVAGAGYWDWRKELVTT
jgi:phage N-6-adenine-methyltransferase